MRKSKCRDRRRNNKPPAQYQFKPGQSGNKSGRPKAKDVTFDDRVAAELTRRSSYTEGGETKTATIEALLAMQLVRAALKGNGKALERVLLSLQNARKRARRAARPTISDKYSRENLRKLSAQELAVIYQQSLADDAWRERNRNNEDDDDEED